MPTMRELLGDATENLSTLQNDMLDFTDRCHTRMLEKSPTGDATTVADIVDNNTDSDAAHNLAHIIMKNGAELVEAFRSETYDATSAEDLANAAYIHDAVNNSGN